MSMPAGDAASFPAAYTSGQSADEYARRLSAGLASSVNTGQLASGWLDAHPHRKPRPHRKPPRHPKVRPAPVTVPPPPPPAQRQQNPPPPAPPPKAYLTAAGIIAAITAVLGAVLAALWAAAFAAGWASALAAMGEGQAAGEAAALRAVLAEGERDRLPGIIRTRVSRIERAMLAALREGASADELAAQITAILGSLTQALLVAVSEWSWASGQGALAAYAAAGLRYKRWQTRNDSKVCARCMANQGAGTIPLKQAFPGGVQAPLQHPRCRCVLLPAAPPARAAKRAKDESPVAAGVAVRAADTGRVLMLQRALDPDDPDNRAGLWEFPGGRLEDGESALEAALREWSEETGLTPPGGEPDGVWNSKDGRYRGFVITVPSEDVVDAFGDRDDVANPDDPDGDLSEALAWWDPGLLRDNPSVRPEVAASAKRIRRALKSAETPRLEATPHPLGPHSLWRTPDKHVGARQKLPNYIEHIAAALIRDQGMDESRAIATAVNAVKRWAKGDLHWGSHHHVTPEVIAASRRALAEWEKLKASHH